MKRKVKFIDPRYRFKLKAKMLEAGFKTQDGFHRTTGIDRAIVSRVINGFQIPEPRLQSKMADALGVTLVELRELLN